VPVYKDKISEKNNKHLLQMQKEQEVTVKEENEGNVSKVELQWSKKQSLGQSLNGQFVILYDLERHQTGKLSLLLEKRLKTYNFTFSG